jgi:hypothetical protein
MHEGARACLVLGRRGVGTCGGVRMLDRTQVVSCEMHHMSLACAWQCSVLTL